MQPYIYCLLSHVLNLFYSSDKEFQRYVFDVFWFWGKDG